MANYEDHRIYSYLNEPIRLLGLTLDELGLGLIGISIGLYANDLLPKLIFIISGIGGTILVKRFKKMILGFSLKSFLHWHFGVRGKLYPLWPHSHKKDWLS